MTRKDYVAIAEAVNAARYKLTQRRMLGTAGGNALIAVIAIEDELADVLSADNPRFDRERFLAACRMVQA